MIVFIDEEKKTKFKKKVLQTLRSEFGFRIASNWPEIWKPGITPSEFCPISGA